VIHWPGYAFW